MQQNKGMDGVIEINREEIQKWLSAYPPENVHLIKCCRNGLRFAAEIEPHQKLFYSSINVSYYTAVQIELIVSQIGYVAVGHALEHNLVCCISKEERELLINSMLANRFYYAKEENDFRKPVSNSEVAKLLLDIHFFRKLGRRLFVFSTITINSNGFIGERVGAVTY